MKDLEKVETDLIYLQDEVRQLNEIVTTLQATVTKLEKQNELLMNKIEDLETEARPSRRPPHY